jgi:uncharacterized protein YtpQ (UPF0354 family)
MFGKPAKKPVAQANPDRSTLVPRIKHLNFTAALKAMNIPADQLPYTEPLVADLLVTYAFDLPGLFQMASQAALAAAGIAPAEARDVAIGNLKKQLPGIGVQEHGPVCSVVTGNNLEACTLLATTWWEQMATQIPGEIVAAVPSRDVLLFCSSQSLEGLAALKSVSSEVLQQETTHALTSRLLVWRKGQWKAVRESASA